jgi:hypothetical protein
MVNLKMVLYMVKEKYYGMMERNIKDNSKKIN